MPRRAWIPHKRAFLAQGLRGLGLLGLLERLARRPGLAVLCYHRIGDPRSDPYYSPLISATPEVFREQIRLLRERFRLVTLDQVLAAVEGASLRLDEPMALISFDDGYRDNVELAWPILQELEAPAAFFLTTDFVGEGHLPWWDHVAYVVKHRQEPRLTLERPEPLAVEGSEAMAEVIAAYLRADRPEDPALLAHLEERAGARPPEDAGRRLFFEWDEARRLAEAGMGIGAHTVSHRRLAQLSEADQADELVHSRAILEREIGREVRALAYPYGDPTAFNTKAIRQADASGYRIAFALRPGLIQPGPLNRFNLPRFPILMDDSPTLLRARLALSGVLGRSLL